MAHTMTTGRLDYGNAFREVANAARKDSDYAGTKFETRPTMGNTDYGHAFEEVAAGARQQGNVSRRNARN